MKRGSVTTVQSQIGSQLSEQQTVKSVQSDQKRKYQLVYGFGIRILGCARYFIHRLPWGRKNQQKQIFVLLMHLMEEIAKKQPQMKKKRVLFHQVNALCHKSITTMAKFYELHFEFLPH